MISRFKSVTSIALCLLTCALAASAEAAVDTDIQGIVTDAAALWATVKTLIVGIVAVLIGIWVVKKIRAR